VPKGAVSRRAGLPSRGATGSVRGVTAQVEELSEVTDEAVDAFGRLIPQLSRSAKPLDRAAIAAIVDSPGSRLLVARTDGVITGMLTLVLFRIPTGVRAIIEDVVTDDAARGQGVGTALTLKAIELARAAGVKTVDLTSRPARVEAGRLYEKLGFELRDTRVYRYAIEDGAASS
jgi:ribosomal protein S18 acetylase RimI-like enzyme